MTDWRGLPAGRELDLCIAHALGYKTIAMHRYMGNGYPFPAKENETVDGYALIDLEGHYVEVNDRNSKLPVTYFHSFPEHEASSVLPNYSTDANAAIELLAELPDQWNFTISRYTAHKVFACAISPESLEPTMDSWQVFTADTSALAICHAWLDWKERIHA